MWVVYDIQEIFVERYVNLYSQWNRSFVGVGTSEAA